jgi:hypothetical protein
MRAVLIALVLLSVSPDVLAGGAAWRERRIVVRDYTPAAWQPHVERALDAFNAAMPPAVPRLVYQRRKERRCRALPATGWRGTLAVCADENRALSLWWGWAEYRARWRHPLGQSVALLRDARG